MPPSSGSGSNSSPRKLSPFVFWAQTEDKLTLRVSLQDVSVSKKKYRERCLSLSVKVFTLYYYMYLVKPYYCV